MSVVIGASLVAVLLGTLPIVRRNALNRAAVDLDAARVAFYHLVDSRAAFATAQLRLVTELPVFRAHLTDPHLAADAATIREMADEYRRSMGAHFSVVTDSTGRWIASPGWPNGAAQTDLSRGVERGLQGEAHREIAALGERLYLVVTEPARFVSEVLATVSAGYQLDDTVAQQLAVTTRCDVTLVTGGRPSGSSLPFRQRDALVGLLAQSPTALGGPKDGARLRAIGDAQYVGGAYPLSPDAPATNAGTLILLQDWLPTQQFVDRIRSGTLGVGAVMVLVALGGGVAMSRRITRPLREMAAVTGEVAAGRWDRRVPVRGTDEMALLATAFNDMTDSLSHWHAEAQVKTAQLQDSYERFYAVTQSAHDAIISIDKAGAVRFWNQAAVRIFGYEEAEILGRQFDELLDEASRQTYHTTVERIRRGNNARAEGITAMATRKDGNVFPLELSLAIWTGAAQLNVTAIVRDITERRRAEEALRKSETELRQAQKMEEIGRLAGGVAHDFNNLLTAIRGYAELLFADLDGTDPRRADAVEILKAAESAGSLTRQLLAFSRKQILAPRLVSLDATVRGLEKMLRRLIREDIDLVVESSPAIWPVKADPGQIEQVVLNLVVNARDAMPTGGRLSVTLTNVTVPPGSADGSRPGDYVAMTVADSGSGMDAATLEHIFEPFFTTKDEGRGTGLGLAMVDGIVEQSGGFITVDSRPGEGTTFRVLLPRAQEDLASTSSAAMTANVASASETVLLVEDEASVRRFAHQVLTREGYQVIEASHGAEALVRATNHPGPIHLLLTDVVMPGMSGRVLWEHVSAVRSETKVLFVSGYIDDAVIRHGIQDAGLPYLQKPFSLTSLSDAVRRVLGPNLSS